MTNPSVMTIGIKCYNDPRLALLLLLLSGLYQLLFAKVQGDLFERK